MRELILITIRELRSAIELLYFIVFNRKNVKERKVVFFGAPLLCAKYITEAIREMEVPCRCIVPDVYAINSRCDFDIITRKRLDVLNEIKESRFILNFYDSIEIYWPGISRYLFYIYIKVSNKKLIVMPYGADAFEYSKLSDKIIRHGLIISYPQLGIEEKKITRRIQFMNKLASFRIACIVHLENLPTWDILPVHYYPIDQKKITLSEEKFSKFTIVHSPNHKGVKGTEFISRAIEELKDEGHELDYILIQGFKNDEVIKILQKSHLLVEQLLLGGYAMSGMEGMAAGLPVISNLRNSTTEVFKIYSYLNECPIVHSDTNVQDLKEKILYCKSNYNELSRKSLDYVMKFHSYSANAKMWGVIFDYLDGKIERPINYFHPVLGDFYKSY